MTANKQIPRYTSQEINAAGAILRNPTATDEEVNNAFGTLSFWRQAHYGPLVMLRSYLERAGEVGQMLVGSRLKRIPTMLDKLRRVPRLDLYEFQDVGGLRAVVKTAAEAAELAQRMLAPSEQFVLVEKLCRNYMERPKSTGYRSIHLIYRFQSTEEATQQFDGLKIELQIRTRLQHAWATSNEIVGTFRQEALKSGEGSPDWLRFFTLAAHAIAEQDGIDLTVRSSEEAAALATEFGQLRTKLNVHDRLSAYTVSSQVAKYPHVVNSEYFVLVFDLAAREVFVNAFDAAHFQDAMVNYRANEQGHLGESNFDTLFVSVKSLSDLEEAFPNYFADTAQFLNAVYSPEEIAAIDARTAEIGSTRVPTVEN